MLQIQAQRKAAHSTATRIGLGRQVRYILFAVVLFSVGCKQDNTKPESGPPAPQAQVSTDTQQSSIYDPKKLEALPPSKREAVKLMNQFMEKLKYLQSDYANQLRSIGWSGILDVARIGKDKTFAESDSLVAKAARIIAFFRIDYDAKLAEMAGNIASSTMSEDAKKSMLKSFNATIAGPGKDSSWILESQIVGSMKEMFRFLKKTEGKWTAGEEIKFSSNADQMQLQNYSVTIQSLFIKEEEHRKSLAAYSSSMINALKD